jgi:ribose-phosphate pyrophosphokinase
MITIRQNAITLTVTPTLFPDGTSQVWQLPLERFNTTPITIVWHFEQEAELIWVNQLIRLLNANQLSIAELFMPYLPYGRQDKAVSNTSTFAKEIFLDMLFTQGIGKLSTIDAHSDDARIVSYSPAKFIEMAITAFKPDVLVFPDASAQSRYAKVINTNKIDCVVLNKLRDQTTGLITQLALDLEKTSPPLLNANSPHSLNMLIIDDICDGGATFVQAALFLKSQFACNIGLYVTHGIFSKGMDHLIASGIAQFYTTQSLIKNTSAFSIEELTK